MKQNLAYPVVLALLAVWFSWSDASSLAAPSLQLPWPNGHQHRVNSGGYSYNCGGHTGSNAYAIDLEFTIGQYVSSNAVGVVTVASKGYSGGAGNYLEVDHGGGYKSRYLHLRADADGGPWPTGIGVGAIVSQGQHIGYSGNTGGVPAHLHFDLKLNGAAYMPEPMSGMRNIGAYGNCTGQTSSLWISRHPTDVQQVSDSTGDNRDDAVVFLQGSGSWPVAPSSGSSFQSPAIWRTGHGVGSNRQFWADVNHDGKADAVVWFAGSGSWYVALSTGSSYGSYSLWRSGHGVGSTNQFLADVNQDGRADAVAFFYSSGSWYVALSTGTSFGGYSLWRSGHGSGSDDQLLADVNGDLRADAVAFFNGSGNWYVSLSTGSAFNPYSLWGSGHGTGSDRRFLADVDADLDADAVVFFGGGGSWYTSKSNGSSFGSYSLWSNGHGTGSDNQTLADASGDNRADAGAYFNGSGSWYEALSNGNGFNGYSLWRSNHGTGS